GVVKIDPAAPPDDPVAPPLPEPVAPPLDIPLPPPVPDGFFSAVPEQPKAPANMKIDRQASAGAGAAATTWDRADKGSTLSQPARRCLRTFSGNLVPRGRERRRAWARSCWQTPDQGRPETFQRT